MRYRLFFLSLGFVLPGLISVVAGQDTLLRTPIDSGLVRIFKDPRLDLLIEKQIEVNELTTRSGRRVTMGFRLLVLNTRDRQEAINTKAWVYDNFPELKPYLWHQAPFYKVKVGNFKTQPDAEFYAKKIRSQFPKGVFVIKDEIDTYFLNVVEDPSKNKKKN